MQAFKGIYIRTELRSGDIGYVAYLHGTLYQKEYGYGLSFEAYVAKGLAELYHQFDRGRDRVWICENENRIVGFLALMHRENNSAQLRYFLLEPLYRGRGLGRYLMEQFMQHLKEKGFEHAYLWTTHEQKEASVLYQSFGFRLTEEHDSTAFGKPLKEQRYDMDLRSSKQ